MSRLKVAFICVHNSCRSQIAEALGTLLAADVMESYSAGTEIKAHINPDATRLMRQLYGVEMPLFQHPKLLGDIPAMDIVITMGCLVQCPCLPCQHMEDWGLEDPSGQSDAVFTDTIVRIHQKVLGLRDRIRAGLV